MDNILSSERSATIKFGLGFHETVEGESSSQDGARNLKGNNAKPKMLKEIRSQPDQQPRKEILQINSCRPNHGNDSQLFPQMNNVEWYVCHNLGHVAARCRRRMVHDYHSERSSRSRYFKGYCFSCNMFGHKVVDCYRRNMKHVRCYACNKLGHIAKECRNKVQAPHQKEKTSSHLKIWKKKEAQFEKCGTTQYTQTQHNTDITDSERVENIKL